MNFIKIGEASIRVENTDFVLNNPSVLARMADDSEVISYFKKVAAELKKIAPKAKDFLYFSAVMMHAAEASLLDEEGNLKKDAKGNSVTATWNVDSRGSWKWVCSDANIKPFKNSNGDIFPRSELIEAYKQWVGKPLCIDHKSSSVDHTRGIIVDTYYDHSRDRVIALCALDKVNYPDLARKVQTKISNCVSMGTGVREAICFDCGQVARIEADFCSHMQRKNGYGEINIGLSPIELSIVVTGADPKAKIKEIFAAANSIARYVESKKEQLYKMSADETQDIALATDIITGLEKIQEDASALKEKITQLKKNEESEQESDQNQVSDAQVVAAIQDEQLKKLFSTLEMINIKVGELDKKINSISGSYKDTDMTQKNAYYQGGGGVNEPTPGKPKYPAEEAESYRNQDKHMLQTQDMGSVDGMFPGDEQKKRELLRMAEIKEREMKRKAALAAATEALQKGAYYQGAGGVNEPTPGKPKYPKEDSDKIREQDLHLTGKPPFPGVGKIDGLYDKDLETKKKLLRAKLKAVFVKAGKSDGSEDPGSSRWQVYADDKLILTATVNEITGNKSDALYASVATKEFGKELIAKIKSEGFEKAARLYKGAQAAPAPAAPPAGAAPGADLADPLAGLNPPSDDSALDQGNSGDPKEQVSAISQELNNLAADLAKADQALSDDTSSNELAEIDQMGSGAEGVTGLPATANTKTLIRMQKKLSAYLAEGVRQLQAQVADHQEELKLVHVLASDRSILSNASAEQKEAVTTMIADACNDARKILADGMNLRSAFVRYARGTQGLIKKARKTAALSKTSQQAEPFHLVDPKYMKVHNPGDPLDEGNLYSTPDKPGASYTGKPTPRPHNPTPIAKVNPVKKAPPKKQDTATTIDDWPEDYGRQSLETMLINNTREYNHRPAPVAPRPSGQNQSADDGTNDEKEKDTNEAADKDVADKDKEKDTNNAVKVDNKGNMSADTPEEAGKAMKAMKAAFDTSTKEGRAAFRAKLAEKSLTFSDMLSAAHGKSGPTINFDVKPTGDLGKVETLEETHKAMLDIATAPVKVRKQAEQIQKLVVAGHINPSSDFPQLIESGLEPAAVACWQATWGKQAASGFEAQVTADYNTAKVAEEKEAYKVKVLRAFSLAHEMANKGLISKEASAVNSQVGELLEFTEKNFDNLKSLVERQPVIKTASTMPQVGLTGDSEFIVPAPKMDASNFKEKLEACFTNSRGSRW